MSTPSSKLMTRIMHALVQENILTVEEVNKIEGKILSGKIKSEDWHLAIDLSISKVNKDVEKNDS